ncbi:MAG: DNA repair exonuclease [Microthrixaceae bacterium]
MFEFLHAADLHLDTQPSGLHGYPEDVAEVLRDASLGAFENLVQTAIDRGVAFCVFAGDIYDGAERGTRAELAFRRGLVRLADEGIRSYIVHGNHDPLEQGWSTISRWPGEVTVFGTGERGTQLCEIAGTTVAVHGVSYARRDTTENLASRFQAHPDAEIQIGVLHTNAGGNPEHAPYAPCSIDELRSSGFDYWALGHIHSRRTLAGPDPWIVYPGNTQGRHPGASEQGPKGAVVVGVGDDGTVREPEFVALDVLRFARIDVPVDDLADLGALSDELDRRCNELRADNEGRALVIRAHLTGRGPVHAQLADPPTRSGAWESVREEWSGRTPVVWWDRFTDETAGDLDLEELEDQDDFAGNALAAIRSLPRGEGDDLERELERLRRLSPPLERLGVPTPRRTDPELVGRARALAAHLLTEEER